MYSQWIWNLKPLPFLVEFSVLWIFSYSVYHDENVISCTGFHNNCMFFCVQDQHLCLSLQKFYFNILQVFLTVSLIMHFGLSGNCKEILLNDYHVKILFMQMFPFSPRSTVMNMVHKHSSPLFQLLLWVFWLDV